MTYTYDYPRASVTVDIVVFCRFDGFLKVLLIQRARPPFEGKWAFPGGFIEMDETLLASAQRELEEETRMHNVELRQFRTYGDPGRDPRGRTVSVIFYGFTDPAHSAVAGGDDASSADWFPIDQIPDLAFDHETILKDLLEELEKQ